MNQDSRTTRLTEYIAAMLPDAHGHQQKAIFAFVCALIAERSCSQATLARWTGNFEAGAKRLSRFLHNERLEVERLAPAPARLVVSQVPTLPAR